MKSNLRPGYVSILAVVTLSSILLVMLTASFRFAIQNQETQKKTQVRIDYTNREKALLRAVLSEAPNQAMRAMMTNSSGGSWNNKARWRWIFQYARDKADGETAVDPNSMPILGISGTAISGNTGDGTQDHIVYSVKPVADQPYDHWFYLNAGVNSIASVLGSNYPEALTLSGGTTAEKLERDSPIITMNKTYSTGDQFKLLPYPKTSFGYMVQGQNFVAKRNWWAFRLTYGAQSEGVTGVKTADKDYVLSIYEVPSQLGLGSTVDTILGKHADGTNWAGINVQGPVFGSKVATEGTVAFDSLSTRRGASISSNTTVGGVGHNAFTGALPDREKYMADNNAYYPISSSADSGLVSFIPISRGEEAFDDLSDTDDSSSLSPTGWNYYSRPAMQCVMKLRVEDVISVADQTPTSISFTYQLGGIPTTETFTRGTNWPTESSVGGATFPFHLETSNVGRPAIAVHIDRMVAHLQAAGADSLDINHSLIVNSNYPANALVQQPNIPSQSTDISLILRDSKDFTDFPKGFSLVSPYRLYLANDVNVVSNGTDAGGNPSFPPISLFAPEKRFGVRNEAINIDFEGQINQIGDEGSTATARPLDLRSGVDDEVISNNISADLYSITTPDQIPPINQMNWLIVIERVN